MDQASETPTVKKRGSNPFKQALLLLTFSIVLVGLTAGITLGYAYRGEIKNELCSMNFSRFVVEKALGSDCGNVQITENEDDRFSIDTDSDRDPFVSENTVDVPAIYELTKDSVVGIGISSTRLNPDQEVIGSGFVISEDGLIATNQHVVSDTGVSYFVKFPNDNNVVTVEEIYRDEVNDVAFLQIERENLKGLTLGDSDSLRPGEPVIAIGNPLGELNSTVTTGIVSGLHRTVEVGSGSFLRSEFSVYEDTIQTDAAINPGNSGGPLLNAKGEVIGINFATIAGADNLSFAIPVSYVKIRLEELNEHGRFRIPYIGIQYTTELVEFRDKVYVGARIIDLDPEGSAEGLLERNDIIIEIDGKTLENNSVAGIIQRLQIGDVVDVDVIRDGRLVTETVEIIERE